MPEISPRANFRRFTGVIVIPKDMEKGSWKIEVVCSSDGVTRDITDYVLSGNIERVASVGLSSFSLEVDNSNGMYKNINTSVFSEGDPVNIYYDFSAKASLTTIRFRGYIDGIYHNFDYSGGFTLTLEGRDAPKSSSNEHFSDSTITIQFVSRNVIDCFIGTEGTLDAEGNYEDGILYNSGLILKVYDTSSSSWKIYKDLSASAKLAIKQLSDYDATVTDSWMDRSRITCAQDIVSINDLEFRIYYDSSTLKSYFMLHQEEAIINTAEGVAAGQNLITLNRYGRNTTEEYNRIKETGKTDGSIMMFRTKEDTTRQSALWIKDKSESNNALTTDAELTEKADARLDELKRAIEKGSVGCCTLPSLQPGERIPFVLPYVINSYIKVKSFNVTFGAGGMEMSLNLQARETSYADIFKERIDETTSITPTDNPNGMSNAVVFDFVDEADYSLDGCQIEDEVLSLMSGESTGTCTTNTLEADENITQCELRIKANQFWNCTYRVSNNGGISWEDLTRGTLHTFTSTGKDLKVEITLNEPTVGVSPEFDKVNLLYK